MNNYTYNPYFKRQQEEFLPNSPTYYPTQSSSAPGVGSQVIDNTYAEELLNKNIGKHIKVYTSFSDSIEWKDKIFEGTLEAWGRDFFLINDKMNNKWYMVWALYTNFIEFNEDLNL